MKKCLKIPKEGYSDATQYYAGMERQNQQIVVTNHFISKKSIFMLHIFWLRPMKHTIARDGNAEF